MVKKDKYFASILVIGDEVLSGRTLDTNSNHIAKKIEDLGISVNEIRVIPDNKGKIIKTAINLFILFNIIIYYNIYLNYYIKNKSSTC